jgi:hypothetical protein
MLPQSKRDLKNWVLRRLGGDVIRIEISPQQCEDRLCEALNYFNLYHIDGAEDLYLKHIVTASLLESSLPLAVNQFTRGEILTGSISGATTRVIDHSTTTIRTQGLSDIQFVAGETITGSVSLNTTTLTNTNFFTIGDIDKKYIQLDDSIMSVIKIISTGNSNSSSSMFGFKNQFIMNELPSLISTDIVSYDLFKRHLDLLDFELRTSPQFRFNGISEKLYIDAQWGSDIVVDDTLVFKVRKILDYSSLPKIYGSWFLLQYTYVLFKLQWGNNLKKYENVVLPGGKVLNGQQIYDEAITEMEKLEVRLKLEFRDPCGFILMG